MKKNPLLILCSIFLSISAFAQSDLQIIQEVLTQSAKNYRLAPEDVQDWVITDKYVSRESGVTHIYLRQTYQNIEVRTANAAIHLKRNGQVLTMSNDFVAKLSEKIANNTATIDAPFALQRVAQQMNYPHNASMNIIETPVGIQQQGLIQASNISRRDIATKLVYEPLENGTFTLAWNMPIYELDQSHWWDMRIDATTGEILSKDNWITSCNFDDPNHNHDEKQESKISPAERPSPLLPHAATANANLMVGTYNVYAMPTESPNFGNRSFVSNPDHPTASPFGWHDTNGAAGAEFTITRGNNCHAYEDGDNSGFSPNGGAALNFDFPFNTTYSTGDQSEAAAITNLFYWTNLCHDVWYQYGFDEASGNFQENNYGNGGAGSDYVNAEAQDGSGTCNANFGTPTDGSNPTMQMFVCNSHDGDVDNAVIVHEYGHGISIRLAGGPSNSGCLNNTEQMGEGWSDWFSMMMTIEPGDAGTDARGMGTWLLSQPANGLGIRTQRYSTDLSVNTYTYNSIMSEVAPHGVGSVWCMMLWEMAWALIDEYGFDPDFYHGTGGNNIAMALVIEGLKLQVCSPGFVDGRDAILAADQALYNGANSCIIWKAFAKRGLGFSANQGSSSSKTDGTQAFDMPPSCSIGLLKTVDKEAASLDGTLTYTLTANNLSGNPLTNVVISDVVPVYTTYQANSASNGGTETGGTVTFPAVNLAAGETITRTFSVTINPDAPVSEVPVLTDDMENGAANWVEVSTNNTRWVQNSTNPHSGSIAWFAQDIASTNQQFLTLANPVVPTANMTLDFYHQYNTEATWDGGVVQISVNNGSSWSDLGAFMTMNGYNSRINNNTNTPAFSGNSNGYILTSVDLSSFAGQSIRIRFVMNCDQSVSGVGWYIDDVTIGKVVKIPNTANITTAEGLSNSASLANPTCIVGEIIPIINFQTTSSVVSEEAVANNRLVGNCRSFTDHTIHITINADPVVAANVQINLSNNLLATTIEDFELLTNNLTISNAGIYPIILRVYDDANLESDEDITLNLVITNPEETDAILGNQATFNFTIKENDMPPTGGLLSSTVINEDLETNDGGLTSINSGGDHWVSGTAANATSTNWTVPSNASTRLFYVNDDDCNCNMSNVKLVLPSVDLSNVVGAALSLDLYFEGRTYQSITETAQLEVSLDGGTTFNPITPIAGILSNWRNETFDLSAYLGNNNVILAIRYNDGGGWLYGMAVDNISVITEIEQPIDIADALNDTDEQYVGTNADVYFYHEDGSLMARLQNGSHNFGCVELVVDRAGANAVDFQDDNAANRLAGKTFMFTPEFNSNTAHYTVTLYYSQAEVEAWETATGQVWTDAKIIKNPSSITNITPANPTPDGAGTVQIQAATANGHPSFAITDYFITTDFDNGFSGMGVGNPSVILPIELSTFTGKHIAQKGNLIEWTTLFEIQNDFFELERSWDGQVFEKIATLNAFVSTHGVNHYHFLDTKYLLGNNYYRLVQQDLNGQRSTTEAIVIQVKNEHEGIQIFPNPTQDVVHVQFDQLLHTSVDMTLFDALGRMVKRQVFNLEDANYFNFNTKDLANGLYHLSLNYHNTTVKMKIVKTN